MKAYLATGLCLTLGLIACRAGAEELPWRPASGGAADTAAIPDVVLSPPVPLRQASYSPSSANAALPYGSAAFVARTGDDAPPSKLPSGSAPMTQAPPQADFVLPISPQTINNTQPSPDGVTGVYSSIPSATGCNCGGGHASILGGISGDSCCDNCGDGCCPSCTDSCCPSCSDNCCSSCCPGLLNGCCMDGCGCCYNSNRSHAWFSAEYLLWQFSNPNAPPLITTGGAGTVANPGPALGQPGTQVINGGNGPFNNPLNSGFRLDMGFWLPCHDNWGVELGFLFFPQRTTTDVFNGGVLGRPFTNALTGQPSAQPVNGYVNPTDGVFTAGSAEVRYQTQIWGADANIRYKLCCGENYRVDLLAGYRNFNLIEGISIDESLSIGGAPVRIADNFNTSNTFNGGQIGVDAEWRFWPRWSIGTQFKLALGDVHEAVNINGTTAFPGFPTLTAASGVFAASSNVGSYSRDQFAVLPEVNLRLNFDVNDHVRLFIGYSCLYLSNAARPGNAIDTTVNPNNIAGGSGVGPARPAFVFTNSGSFWAQGITAGVDVHY